MQIHCGDIHAPCKVLLRCTCLAAQVAFERCLLRHQLRDCRDGWRPAACCPLRIAEALLLGCQRLMLACLCAPGLKNEAQMPRLLQGLTELKWLSLAGNEISADDTMDRVSLAAQLGDHMDALQLPCPVTKLPCLCWH